MCGRNASASEYPLAGRNAVLLQYASAFNPAGPLKVRMVDLAFPLFLAGLF